MPVLVIVLIAAMATAIIHTIECVPSNVRICTVQISIRKDSTDGNFFHLQIIAYCLPVDFQLFLKMMANNFGQRSLHPYT